jgi:hypothetical protein
MLLEANYSSESFVDFMQNIQCHILGDSTFSNHRCENLEYFMFIDLVRTDIDDSECSTKCGPEYF